MASTALAATDPSANNEEEYVDSVYSWGIWELDIEPAAGPRAPANTALNNRALKLKFRPNDNAAYIIDSVAVPVAPITPPPPVPVTPPVIPSIPTQAEPGALPGRGTLR
jgi:hypothetical protein